MFFNQTTCHIKKLGGKTADFVCLHGYQYEWHVFKITVHTCNCYNFDSAVKPDTVAY